MRQSGRVRYYLSFYGRADSGFMDGKTHLFDDLPLPSRLLHRCQITLLGVRNLPNILAATTLT